jgi:tetratricopeptide (TPR) repeat protein
MLRIEALQDPDIKVRVGVHSAYVVAHVQENDYSSVYEAAGPALHLVNRLQEVAEPGQIVVSEACRRLAEGLLTFELLPPRVLRGFAEPATIHRVVGASGLSRWYARAKRGAAPFVGRTSDMHRLRCAAEDARRIPGTAVLVAGEPGIGKSRTAHELLAELLRTGWRVVEVECSPIQQSQPYSTLRDLLRAVLADATGDQAGDQLPTIEAAKNSLSDPWRMAIEAILERPTEGSGWFDLEPVVRRRAIVEASCAVVATAIGAIPTAVLIEDLHWVDAESSQVIEALVGLSARHPLFLLLTSRLENEPGWTSQSPVVRQKLQALDASSAETLLDALLGDGSGRLRLKAQILQHTGGVPLFMEEVTRGILELDPRPSGERTSPTISSTPLVIPPTVQGVIAARIDRLPRPEKALLQLAAAIGRQAAYGLLRRITGIEERALLQQLHALETAEFLFGDGAGPQRLYHFPHDLIREVAYESNLRAQRLELHKAILAAMSDVPEQDAAESAEELCHHAERAEDWQQVARYAHLAARKSLVRSALADATAYFETAMDAVDRLPRAREREERAIDLRLEARLAFAAYGKLTRWLQLGEEAEARATAIGDARRQAAAAAVRAAALNFSGPLLDAVEVGERAVRAAELLGDAAWQGFSEYGLGQAYFVAGRLTEAAAAFQQAGRRLEATGGASPTGTAGPNLLVLCSMMRAAALAALGDIDAAREHAARADALAAGTGRAYDALAAGYSRSVVRLVSDDIDAAAGAIGAAVDLARRNEIRQFLPTLLCQQGNVLLRQGRPEAARDGLLEAQELARELGHTAIGPMISTYLALALHGLGETDRALTLAEAARATARQQGYRWVEGQSLIAIGSILAAGDSGGHVRSREYLEAAIATGQETGSLPQQAYARAVLGRHLLATGDRIGAAQHFRELLGLLTRLKLTRQLARLQAVLQSQAVS